MKSSFIEAMLFLNDRKYAILFLAFGLLMALLIRYPMIKFESGDYTYFLSVWYDIIATKGGFPALESKFSDYNVPYLYLLASVYHVFPDLPNIQAIKFVAIFFDFLMAFFVYKCVRLKYRGGGGERINSGCGGARSAFRADSASQRCDVGAMRFHLHFLPVGHALFFCCPGGGTGSYRFRIGAFFQASSHVSSPIPVMDGCHESH